MAPVLWLVRHAPTRDNVDGVVMGQRDPVPTGEGLRAAATVAAGVTFAHAVSSDARRAYETARAIAPSASLRLDERLRERSLAGWEGRHKHELRAAHPDAFSEGGAVRLDAGPPGCEPLTALLRRVHAALAELEGGEGPVLVVAHNGSLRAALVLLGELDLATASEMSVEHLCPIVADIGHLRPPDPGQ